MDSSKRWLGGRAKRTVDIAVGGGLLVAASPIILLVGLGVRLSLGAPVLFRHQRAGRDGKPIIVPKFRSMTFARDLDGELLPDEERLTRFGELLRTTSLDELPQLWSVVKGDMSLVGPRPLPLLYVGRYSPQQHRRLDAKPGLTGWAQVGGRNALGWPDKFALDVWYVDHASFWVDIRILLLTLKVVLRRSGVTPEGHSTMPEFRGETSRHLPSCSLRGQHRCR